jgi:DNA-binding response OmpR family regulator
MILDSHRTRTSTAPVILIIDADRDFLADFVLALIQAGYEVLTAVNSQEVQYLCELYPHPIHLVALDIPLERDASLEGLLPRQYGNKVVSMIRIKRPCCPILLMSATPAWKISRYRLGASLWQLPFLQRPCSVLDLLQKIRSLLPTTPNSPVPSPISMRQCA